MRIHVLREWKKVIIAKNRRKAAHPPDPEPGLFAYLAYFENARPDFWSQLPAFYSLRKFFLNRCESVPESVSHALRAAVDAARREAPGDIDPYHAPGDEVLCAFYSLVARNVAIDMKWPGGLRAYLKKYRCTYNDEIAANSAVGFSFDKQLVELADVGLDMSEDFTLFDGCADNNTRDGDPCRTNADWLGGLFGDGGVKVFMKH
jgi:hypothetical protein